MRRVEKSPGAMKLFGQRQQTMWEKFFTLTLVTDFLNNNYNVKEETLYVLAGTPCNYADSGEIQRFHPGEVFHVEPGQIHRFGAFENNVEVVEVSTPHLDDVVRLDDDYTR